MNQRFAQMGAWLGAVALTLSLSVLAGCGGPNVQSETFRSAGITAGAEVPGWVEGNPRLWASRTAQAGGQSVQQVQNVDSRVFVVGRAVGHNVLDERNAHQLAVDDAIRQVARQVMTRTRDRRTRQRQNGGIKFMPTMEYTSKMQQRVLARTDAITRLMRQHDVYWERWEVRHGEDAGSGKGVTRWKCWVLMSIGENQLERLAEQTRMRKAAEAAAPAKVYQVKSE
jgi:hypothetical protein